MAQIITSPLASQEMTRRIGDPIMQSLQNLTNMQLQSINKQKERSNMMAGLSSLMPQKQAEAMSYLPPNIINSIMRNEAATERRKKATERRAETEANRVPNKMNSLVTFKKSYMKKKISAPMEAKFDLDSSSLTDVEKKIVSGGALDNEMVVYLNKLTGSPKAAIKLAKRLGLG